MDDRRALTERTREAREDAFAKMGELAPLVRTRGLVPDLREGAPRWPATLLSPLRSIARNDRVLLVTDGLSDPCDLEMHPEGDATGHGCELFVETTEPMVMEGTQARRHWLEWVLWSIADWEADASMAVSALSQFSLITMQVPTCEELARFTLPTGFVPVLIGQLSPSVPEWIALPNGNAALLAAKVLLPDELAHAVALGNDGGIDLADRFARRGDYHLSTLDRPSVLAEPDWRCPALGDPSWRGPNSPQHYALPAIDEANKTLNFVVLVAGTGAPRFLAAVRRVVAPDDHSVPSGALSYLALRLGEIRGFKTVFHCYGSNDELTLRSFTSHVRAVIVAEERGELGPAARRVLDSLDAAVPVLVLGDAKVIEQSTELRGAPAFTAPCEEADAMPAIKAACKLVLTAARDAPSAAPPPPPKPWWKIW